MLGLILVFHFIGWDGGASFLDQSQSEVKQNKSNLDTRLFEREGARLLDQSQWWNKKDEITENVRHLTKNCFRMTKINTVYSLIVHCFQCRPASRVFLISIFCKLWGQKDISATLSRILWPRKTAIANVLWYQRQSTGQTISLWTVSHVFHIISHPSTTTFRYVILHPAKLSKKKRDDKKLSHSNLFLLLSLHIWDIYLLKFFRALLGV